MTVPTNRSTKPGWEARIGSEVGNCSAKPFLTSGPALKFGIASSVIAIVSMSGDKF